jgi:hypothetical protein
MVGDPDSGIGLGLALLLASIPLLFFWIKVRRCPSLSEELRLQLNTSAACFSLLIVFFYRLWMGHLLEKARNAPNPYGITDNTPEIADVDWLVAC